MVIFKSILTAERVCEKEPDPQRSETGDRYYKIVFDQGVLQGPIFVNEVRNEDIYSGLIRSMADVSSHADPLLRKRYGLGRNLARSIKIV